MRELVIGVDLMGGELSSPKICEAALEAVASYPSVKLRFFTTPQYTPVLSSQHDMVVCDEGIAPSDNPIQAIRTKERSTLCMAVDAIKEKKIDALLSLGNTGAYLAKASVTLLPSKEAAKQKGKRRAALLTELPAVNHMIAVLDLGASLVATAPQLLNFAYLGANYVTSFYNVPLPKVALLNIGTEPTKGTDELKKAYELLSKNSGDGFLFEGNIEPNQIFSSAVDVVITSGFAGNIFLKSIEGTAMHFIDLMRDVPEAVATLKRATFRRAFLGGIIVGVDGFLVKCHGASTKEMVKSALVMMISRLLKTLPLKPLE